MRGLGVRRLGASRLSDRITLVALSAVWYGIVGFRTV